MEFGAVAYAQPITRRARHRRGVERATRYDREDCTRDRGGAGHDSVRPAEDVHDELIPGVRDWEERSKERELQAGHILSGKTLEFWKDGRFHQSGDD
jgi:hypothetical protein